MAIECDPHIIDDPEHGCCPSPDPAHDAEDAPPTPASTHHPTDPAETPGDTGPGQGGLEDEGDAHLLLEEAPTAGGEVCDADAVRNTILGLKSLRTRTWLRRVRCVLVLAVLLTCAVLSFVYQKRLLRVAIHCRGGLLHLGFWGIVIVQLVFVAWILLMLPTTGYELMVAFIYGFGPCFLVSMIGKTLGSIIVFCIARRFLKRRAERAVKHNATLASLLSLAHQHSFWTVCLVRMAYIPLMVKNIGLSAFPISLAVYSSSTFLTGIPYALCWSWLGSTLTSMVDLETGDLHLFRHWQAIVAVVTGSVFNVVLLVLSCYVTRRLTANAQSVPKSHDQSPEAPCPSDVTVIALDGESCEDRLANKSVVLPQQCIQV